MTMARNNSTVKGHKLEQRGIRRDIVKLELFPHLLTSTHFASWLHVLECLRPGSALERIHRYRAVKAVFGVR